MQAEHATSPTVGAGVGVGETGTEADEGRRLAAVVTPREVGAARRDSAEAELDNFARGTPQSVHLAVDGL